MKEAKKMNFLYKIAFILLLLCIPLLLLATAVAYLQNEIYYSAVFSAGGAFLAFVGIILAMFSKPKKSKANNDEIVVDNINNI